MNEVFFITGLKKWTLHTMTPLSPLCSVTIQSCVALRFAMLGPLVQVLVVVSKISMSSESNCPMIFPPIIFLRTWWILYFWMTWITQRSSTNVFFLLVFFWNSTSFSILYNHDIKQKISRTLELCKYLISTKLKILTCLTCIIENVRSICFETPLLKKRPKLLTAFCSM